MSEKELISNISDQLKYMVEMDKDMSDKSWGSEDGVLLTGNETRILIDAIKTRDAAISKPLIPEWIIKYDKTNCQSSAGKAIRELISIINGLKK